MLSRLSIRRNPLYYKVFGRKYGVGDAQKHLSSTDAKQQSR